MNINNYRACPECDLLLNSTSLDSGEHSHCPRCGFLLARAYQHSVERSFSLSIAGFILVFPTLFLPMINIKIMGNSSEDILWSGVLTLFEEDMWAVAIVVLLVSILFPIVHIILSLLVSGHLYFQHSHAYLVLWMRWIQHLDEWVMLEVYMLGIIVACVKLMSIAQLKFGLGLYAFVVLLIITRLLASNLDKALFWQAIAQLHENV